MNEASMVHENIVKLFFLYKLYLFLRLFALSRQREVGRLVQINQLAGVVVAGDVLLGRGCAILDVLILVLSLVDPWIGVVFASQLGASVQVHALVDVGAVKQFHVKIKYYDLTDSA